MGIHSDCIVENLLTPVVGTYDIVVCGGGIAGCSAAVAAARLGAKVLLLEKSVMLGGLATLGLISWFEPLCDGKGMRMLNGIPYELLRLSVRYGLSTIDDEWLDGNSLNCETTHRCASHFSHSIFSMALDEWVLDAGVHVMFDCGVVGLEKTAGHIQSVIVENKDGRVAYRAGMVIDATGDADVAVRCAVPWEDGVNYLTYVSYYADMGTLKKALETEDIMHVRRWMNPGADLWGRGHPEGMQYFTGINAEDQTRFILEGRKRSFERIRELPPKSRDVTALPGMAQYRKTRRILGKKTITEADVNRREVDSIGMATDMSKRGFVYEMPYGCLYSDVVDNLFVAGRCISATGWAWDVTRVIPACACTGQAAGTAAYLCLKNGCGNDELVVSSLQMVLKSNGVWLHMQ